MKYYQSLQSILSEIFGCSVVFAKSSHRVPTGSELVVSHITRTSQEHDQSQVFAGQVTALIKEMDLLFKTKWTTQGHWGKTVQRVDDYETLQFSDLVIKDYPFDTIKQII